MGFVTYASMLGAQRPRSAARAEEARLNTANVHAGRLERRVGRSRYAEKSHSHLPFKDLNCTSAPISGFLTD